MSFIALNHPTHPPKKSISEQIFVQFPMEIVTIRIFMLYITDAKFSFITEIIVNENPYVDF